MEISKQSIIEAHERIKAYVHRTPVLTSESINTIAGCNVYFKAENLQKVGAFKARGAMNAALQIPEAQRSKGVATHSSGNHAQAIARAGKILGIPAYIVMPNNAPQIKKMVLKVMAGKFLNANQLYRHVRQH